MGHRVPNLTVFHGTSHVFRVEVEDHGLRARPGKTRGVRIALDRKLAMLHASAYCAYMMMTQAMPPKALIATASIDKHRIKEGAPVNPLAEFGTPQAPIVGPALTVPEGIAKHEISLTEIPMPWLKNPAAGKRAIEMWERLTDQQITIEPARPGGRGRMKR